MVSLSSLSFLYLVPLLYPALSRADCECGYLLTQTGQRYTHQLVNDFSRIEDATGLEDVSRVLPDWEIQVWGVDPDPSQGTLGRQNDPANVWVQDGLLHLRQRGHPDGDTGPVSVAEMHSRRDDFFHGSFRAKYRVQPDAGGVGGSVAGFFFYYDNSTETDIEILTRDNETTIHYTQHPSLDVSTGALIPDATFQDQLDTPWTEYQEHRFDWMPGLTTFFQTNTPQRDMRVNVPNHDGTIMMNLWSNNGSWSGAPSTVDVHMTVQYVIMYFNTTASDAGEDQDFNARCDDAGGFYSSNAICEVQDEPGIASSAPALKAMAWHGLMFVVIVLGSTLMIL